MECQALLQHHGQNLILLPKHDLASCMQTGNSPKTIKVSTKAGHESHGPNLERHTNSGTGGSLQYKTSGTRNEKVGSGIVHKNQTISHH